jgi:hypothetical protein
MVDELSEWADAVLAGTGITAERAGMLARGAAAGDAAEVALAPTLTAGWAIAAGADPLGVDPGEGTVEMFDLAVALRAAAVGRAVDRLSYRTVPGDWPLVAVTVTGRGPTPTITVQRPGTPAVTGGIDTALTALGAPGGVTRPYQADDRECLVVADRATLARLVAVAEAAVTPTAGYLPARAPIPPGIDAAAARLAWWQQRAEHPGSAATISATGDATRRWASGNGPAAEAELATWVGALGLATTAPTTATLLEIAGRLRHGTLLPAMADRLDTEGNPRGDGRAGDDARSWDAFCEARARLAPWRTHDSPRAAALGLRSRCDATEFFERSLLDDPRWAVRARLEGKVVVATVRLLAGRVVTLVAHQTTCRYRPGTKIALRLPARPHPGQAPAGPVLVAATMLGSRIDPGGRLVIEIDCYHLAPKLPDNRRVEIVPPAVSLAQQARGRQNMAERYRLAPPAAPNPRTVPLDVMVAAADDH